MSAPMMRGMTHALLILLLEHADEHAASMPVEQSVPAHQVTRGTYLLVGDRQVLVTHVEHQPGSCRSKVHINRACYDWHAPVEVVTV